MAGSDFGPIERLSHAYIVSAPTQADCLRQARHIAAAAVCEGSPRPCGLCRHCRKAEAGIHPDIIYIRRLVDDKGNEKKNILVEQARDFAADAYILPNEAAGKAYIIQDADTMNPNAQNAALKLFEEPPKGVVFILCVTNPSALLPTVRSRCVELSFAGQSASDPKAVKLAQEFIAAVAGGKASELFAWCSKNEGMELRRCVAFMDAALDELADISCSRKERMGMSIDSLMHLSELLQRCRNYSKVNVSTKHLLGLLAVQAIRKTETEEN